MDSLPKLHQELRACHLCYDAGHQVVPGAVFSSGPRPQVMLIGQAPGFTEVQVKRPFNANAGRRLFQWLGEAGWNETMFRSTHYMSAVTKCYPGKHPSGKGDRVPSRPEQKMCRPYLEREFQLIQPRVVILVGKLAIALLYPNKTKLVDIIGTAAYFPPEKLLNPVNFNLAEATRVSQYAGQQNGRFIVPLPHPSGASLWPNKRENKALIGRAIELLSSLREAWQL